MYQPQIRLTRKFWRIAAGVLGFILLLFALAAWQVPEVTRRVLTRDVGALLGREIQVGKITFNPFTLTLRVHDLAVQQPGSPQALLTLAEATASLTWNSIFWFAPIVDAFVLHEPRFAIVRTGPADFNFSDITKRLAHHVAAPPADPQKPKSLPRFSLNNMRLENGAITLDDRVAHRQQVIDGISVGVPFISSFGYATEINVLPHVRARINGSPFNLEGTALPFEEVPNSTLEVVFQDLALERWADTWGVPLPIKLNRALLDSDLRLIFEQPKSGSAKLRVTGGIGLRDLNLSTTSNASPDKRLLAWQALTVRGLDMLPLERQLHIAEVALRDPSIQVQRYADQHLNWLDVMDKLQQLKPKASPPPARAAAPPPARVAAPPPTRVAAPPPTRVAAPPPTRVAAPPPTRVAAPASSPWRVNVERFALSEGQVHWHDAVVGFDYSLAHLALTVQRVQWPQPKNQSIDIQLDTQGSDGGRLQAKGLARLQPMALKFDLKGSGLLGQGALTSQGNLNLQPLSATVQLNLSNLNVAPLAPYVASSVNATIRSLKIGAQGQAKFAAAHGPQPLQASWHGDVAVTDLSLQDRVNRADFLAWQTLSLAGMKFFLSGKQADINLGQIDLNNFYGKILLNEQGRLNVRDLVVAPGTAAGSITNDTQTRAAPISAESSTLPAMAVQGIRFKKGRVSFNDRFIKPHYAASLSALEGSVSAVSSSDPQPADVKVTGRVNRTAPVLISGRVNPFNKVLALDIKASSKGIGLENLTTYATKYVGYPIIRGKLSLDLTYLIKNRELKASNQVRLDQLTFGAKVPSPTATTLPVMLAVSLLKDRHGIININLPVSGSLNDPKFSVGGIIWQVFSNLIIRAATSPFSLLASAFGGGDELSFVTFEPGNSDVNDESKDKLKKLAAALSDRPALKMDIAGRVDPVSDEAGLRQVWLESRIRAAWAEDVGENVHLDNANATASLSAADRAKYLAAAYKKADIPNKPSNILGIDKDVPVAQMEALIRQAAPVGSEQLRQLADTRAQAVYLQLQKEGAPMDRIFVVAPLLSADNVKSGNKPTRAEFTLRR